MRSRPPREVMVRETFVFHVRLAETTPPVWRRLEVRAEGTFWNLHCAIQDAMPWEDRHLHEFLFPAGDHETRIGIPELGGLELDEVLASWETPLRDWFAAPAAACRYVYDFGDHWVHTVTLEARGPAQRGGRYPRCTAGERRCPPEDVGGVHGYQTFLAALSNPRHSENETYRHWIGLETWDSEEFDPEAVRFSKPGSRLRRAGLG